MEEKEKPKRRRQNEIEHPEITEIEHETTHPLPDAFRNLWSSYDPGENEWLNERQGPQS